ncbi:hypothetical protein BJ6T_20350 [Bradyrhizobium japonicum USDA 6]|nr:hypothetical protein BJ6T_20350 [Bradyrhizobium japonicum USDA 6]
MGTSGTGHDRCPSLVSRAHQAPGPPCGGDWKIIKTGFGFKGSEKFPASPGRLVNGFPQRHKQPRGIRRRDMRPASLCPSSTDAATFDFLGGFAWHDRSVG